MKNILLFITFILYCTITYSQCWESIDVKGDTNIVQLAIQTDGTLWDLTPGTTPNQVGNDNDWDRCFTSSYSSFAIQQDSTLWGWGPNYNGELGINNTNPVPLPILLNTDKWITVSSSWGMTTAIKSDGTLWYWGDNSQLVPSQVGSENDWKELHTNYNTVLALKTDGSLWKGSHGDILTQVGTDNDWNYIWTNQQEWFGIKNNGTLWSDGVQVGTDTDWISIVGDNNYGAYNNKYALKNNQTLWHWSGSNSSTLVQLNAYQNWKQVGANYNGTYYAIDSQGHYWQGSLGDSLLPSNMDSLCSSLSLKKSSDFDLIKIYPNPSNGKLYLDLNQETKVIHYSITNLQGKNILSGVLNHSENCIDLSNYKRGLYFVKLEDNKPIKIVLE